MDELLNQVYHEIIYNLLIHPPNQALNVLKTHAQVVDDDFLQVLRQTVTTLTERNCQQDADFLNSLVQKVEESGGFSTLFAQISPPQKAETPNKKAASQQQKPATAETPSPEKQSAAEQLYNQGTQQFQANQYTAAFQSWQQALQLYREVENKRGEVNCLGKLGNVYQSLGQYQQAITCHQQALGIARNIKYRQAEANALSSLGHVCYSIGQYDQAISGYQQALSIAQTIKYRVGEANTLGNLGNVYYVLGKLEDAVKNYQQALAIAQELNYRFGAVNFLNNLGNVYASLEQYEQAIAYVDQALTLARTLNYRFGEAYFLSNIGKIYIAKKEPEQARVYFEQYLELIANIDSPQMEANALHHLANTYEIMGDSKSAIANYQKSLELHRQTQNPQGEAMTLNRLGQIYQECKQTDTAIQALLDCLKIATPKALPTECLNAGHHLGDLGLSTYNWRLSRQGYEQAIQAIEHICTGISPLELRSEIAKESEKIYPKLVQACINLEDKEKAFEFVERWRCQQRLELTDSSRFPSGEIQQNLKKYERFQQQIHALHLRRQSDEMKQLTTAGVRLNSSATFKTESEILETLETERQKIWEEIYNLDPVIAEKLQINPLSLEEIQGLISDDKTAILSFYSTEENTYIFGIGQDKIWLHCCEGESRETLQSWIGDSWIKTHQKSLREWRNQMIQFLSELSRRLKFSQLISDHLLDCKELIIIPHLNLYHIPFAALPIQIEDKVSYLCDRFSIRVISSCQMLNYNQQEKPEISSYSMGILEDTTGDIVLSNYEGQKLAELYQVSEERYLAGETAMVSQFEGLIKEIQLLYLGSSLSFTSELEVEEQLQFVEGKLSIMQLLTMGIFKALELCLPYLKLEDKSLSFSEFNLRFVNLFLERDTQRIVYPLWSLEDLATSLLMWFYYQNLQQQNSSSQALRLAQIKLRSLTGQELEQKYKPELQAYLKAQQESKNQQKINDQRTLLAWKCQQDYPFESPYYWANFIVYGG
ncbi:MAG: tetratricopeptide repeat protein [Lyngbya sp.]|nr:tetratricopeptide repeat protein [Lyngbya sp.]